MSAEVLERYLPGARELRVVLRERIVDRELLLLLEHEQRATSELLGHGADREHCPRRDRRARRDVRDAVAARKNDLAILHDADRDADDLLLGDVAADDAVDLVHVDVR